MSVDFSVRAKEMYATQLLSRLMHRKYAEFRGFEPKPYPYYDAGNADYARLAIAYLGVDDDAISFMEDDLRDLGDEL